MKKLSLIFFCLILLNCSNGERQVIQPQKTITVNPDLAVPAKRSEMFSDFFFKKLKAPTHIKFAGVDELTIKGDRIYIFDREQGLKLLVFTFDGDFLFEIKSYGRGPGEFIQPLDFAIDEQNGLISILDTGNYKVLFYELDTGTFVNEKKFDFSTEYFSKTKSGYVFFNNNFLNGNDSKNLFFTDNELNVESKKMPIPKNKIGFHYGLIRHFSGENESMLSVPHDNTIYSISETNYEPYLYIDFGEKNLPNDFFDRFTESRDRVVESRRYATNISPFFETDKYIYFNYRYGNKIHSLISKKEDNTVVNTHFDLIKKDIELGPLYPYPLEIYNNYLVWNNQPYELKNYLEEKKKDLGENGYKEFQKENPKLMELDQSLSEDDNSYLIFTKIEF